METILNDSRGVSAPKNTIHSNSLGERAFEPKTLVTHPDIIVVEGEFCGTLFLLAPSATFIVPKDFLQRSRGKNRKTGH